MAALPCECHAACILTPQNKLGVPDARFTVNSAKVHLKIQASQSTIVCMKVRCYHSTPDFIKLQVRDQVCCQYGRPEPQ